MGKIEQGYLGGFTGRLGTAVGSTWNGVSVVRARPPRKRKGAPSELQLEVQAKFLMITNFLRPMTDLFDITFKKKAVGMTGFNKAYSENNEIILGDAPLLTIDYPNVYLSKGGLPNVGKPVVTSPTAGNLLFTWKDNSGYKKALSSDILFVAAYSQDLGDWIYVLKAAARNAGTYTLGVEDFSGKPVQTYIGVLSADRKKVSKSLFAGEVNVL